MNWMVKLWDWSMGATWRTWMFHGCLAFAFSGIFGAWAMMVAYAWGEFKDYLHERSLGFASDWQDHLGDYAAPFVGAGLAHLVGWDAALFHGVEAVVPGAKALLGI